MRIIRWLALAASSAFLLVWVWRGLFAVDQSVSLIPIYPFDQMPQDLFGPLLIGVGWAVLLTFGGTSWASTSKQVRGPIAVASLIEARPTGLTVNDVPQYQLFLQVEPAVGQPYISQCKLLIPARDQSRLVTRGAPIPVHYDTSRPDFVTPADDKDPAVRREVLQWRVARGLVPPELAVARLHGVAERAVVTSLTPTGRYLGEQNELAVELLITPESGESFAATSKLYVHPTELHRIQVGSTLWAYHLAGDQERIAVDLEREVDHERVP